MMSPSSFYNTIRDNKHPQLFNMGIPPLGVCNKYLSRSIIFLKPKKAIYLSLSMSY